MADAKSNGNKPARRKPQISEAERKRRSERMQQLHKEGKAGGEFGKLGGRPKKPRASEVLAEEAEKHKDELLAVLKDSIDPSQPITVRQSGAKMWLEIEGKERQMEMAEEEHIAKMSKDELTEALAEKLKNPLVREVLANALAAEEGDVVDAEVVGEELVPANDPG